VDFRKVPMSAYVLQPRRSFNPPLLILSCRVWLLKKLRLKMPKVM
jgi:hypothetical protein